MNNGFAAADYVIVAGFFVVMLGIGLYFARRMASIQDFFSGGRQVPWWVSGVSLYMTTFSAFTFVAYSKLAYQDGVVCVTIWWFTAVPSILVATYFLAARWRRAVTTSPLEFVENRFGPGLRQGFAWLGLPLIVIDDGLKLLVIGTMLTVSLGLDPSKACYVIAGCGGMILLYTFLGGLWAVMITDFVQFVVMAATVVVLVPLSLARVGGLGGFLSSAPEGFWRPTSEVFSWPWMAAFTVVVLLTSATKWSYVQRFYSVKTDRDARRVGYLVAGLTFFGAPLLFLPAMAARLFMPGIADGNTVYPLLCKALLPVGMMGMVIAAMFSATMSMLSSDYNAAASVLTNDVLRRFWARNASPRMLVWLGRFCTLGIGLLAVGVALYLDSRPASKDLVKLMATLFGIIMPPVAIPMICGLLTRKTSNVGGLAGFAAGCTCALGIFGLSRIEGWEHLAGVQVITWCSSIPTLVALIITSLLFPDPPEKRAQIGRFLAGLEAGPDDRAGQGGSADAAGALRIIGLAAAAMGLVLLVAVLALASWNQARISLAVGAALVGLGGAAALLGPRAVGLPSGKDAGAEPRRGQDS